MESRAQSQPPAPGWIRLRSVVDSGAMASTGNKRMAPGHHVQPSAMSRRGEVFVTANNSEIPNEGQVTLPTFSKELVRTNKTWQIAEIAKPLLSVGEECDEDQWVIFTKYGGMIYSLSTGEVRRFERSKDGAYEMDHYIAPPGPAPNGEGPAPGFHWPG